MEDIKIKVNGKWVSALQGETILEVVQRNGIKVPTLCHLKDRFPSGACRMCVVEVEGRKGLVPSCSEPISDQMAIVTNSQRVINARTSIIELLLANHVDDCLYCERNMNCELQSLSNEYHVTERRLFGRKQNHQLDISSPSIVRDPSKCILCGRCVRVCEEVEAVSAIDFIGRGNTTMIGTAFNKGLNVSTCVNCGQCINVCPTGALREKSHFAAVESNLRNPEKTVVVQHAPSISVSLAEEFGLPSGTDIKGLLNTALRKIGFDVVFDTSFSADLTIMEEVSELIERIENNERLPMFTSCCPGWVKYAEGFQHDLLPQLSTCKSPQQMMGAITKSYFAEQEHIPISQIYSVAIMPCTAKKFEQQEDVMMQNGMPDVDAVLTTRELARLIKTHGIELEKLEAGNADSPLGMHSSAGKIFGASGGVMEAAIRTAYFKLTGKELSQYKIEAVRGHEGLKEAHIDINGQVYHFAVVSGLKHTEQLLADIKAGKKHYHFVEVMACPGGCVNGGGQPIHQNLNSLKQRAAALYQIDDADSIKASHRNYMVNQLYERYLEQPLSHKSHQLLHRTYQAR
jgi:iron-only hydrogenase group A